MEECAPRIKAESLPRRFRVQVRHFAAFHPLSLHCALLSLSIVLLFIVYSIIPPKIYIYENVKGFKENIKIQQNQPQPFRFKKSKDTDC